MHRKIKILITSVGSLVGQNIHDVLEYPIFYRRDIVEIIGTNSIAGSPNNFRCNRLYLVPNTNTEEFITELTRIILNEKPDLILSGRDEDTKAVALLLENNKEITAKLPYGSSETLSFALNKWETWQFCERNNLPFASTFVLGKSGNIMNLEQFTKAFGYPMIAKPIQGFASKGVFYIRSWDDVLVAAKLDDYMFQEYLGDAKSLEAYFTKMDGLTPLFAHAPNVFHHSCHTIIFPDGSFDPVFISKNEHDSGVTMGFRKVENKELEQIMIRFINAIYKEGGFGPVTVQFREDVNGNWKAQEMNMRTNGNTFPRFIMGQDEMGLIINAILPGIDFPVYQADANSSHFLVGKTLSSYVMHPEDISVLNNQKFWAKA
jgi:hypothetical protein